MSDHASAAGPLEARGLLLVLGVAIAWFKIVIEGLDVCKPQLFGIVPA
jgi:hypothetical protein